MKLLRRGTMGNEMPLVEVEGVLYDASPVGDFGPGFWKDNGVARLRRLLDAGRLTAVELADEVRHGSPVAAVGSVICIGQNYAAHAAESGAEPPKQPIVFFKTPNTVAGPDDTVTIARGSEKTDWEVELAIVIGSTASYCDSLEEAASHIGGYVLANDLSERKFQLEVSGGQWSKGKCSPGYMPLGPWIVTADAFDPDDVGLRSWVNGEPRQDSRTSDMIFGCAEIVRDLSQYMQLEPGDVISTGTPEGVAVSGRFDYLKPGDVVEVEIDGLGRQRQTFRAWEG
ncbi:membrane protein [Halomonas sp. S2151]|jgi:2-keto-4-pentenoate hydratase/2-oxohepta-3-ene-1,7-dioic acid hydratase in catechol pathway|uniref:fumarylacetoacetate hydrolase family protein n=1 Tax=Halomonas sp. S2151 TaxID=579478 RepID=UPI0005FA4A51|nr:fumarylacetoacetate hydrolase family protein [Halomonas sp. S2151]KJZ05919.1 membrane protein [Halomonas sp. S2151]